MYKKLENYDLKPTSSIIVNSLLIIKTVANNKRSLIFKFTAFSAP